MSKSIGKGSLESARHGTVTEPTEEPDFSFLVEKDALLIASILIKDIVIERGCDIVQEHHMAPQVMPHAKEYTM